MRASKSDAESVCWDGRLTRQRTQSVSAETRPHWDHTPWPSLQVTCTCCHRMLVYTGSEHQDFKTPPLPSGSQAPTLSSGEWRPLGGCSNSLVPIYSPVKWGAGTKLIPKGSAISSLLLALRCFKWQLAGPQTRRVLFCFSTELHKISLLIQARWLLTAVLKSREGLII